jgi:hypothetical protein
MTMQIMYALVTETAREKLQHDSKNSLHQTKLPNPPNKIKQRSER